MVNFVVKHDTFVLSPSGKSAVAAEYSGRMEFINFVTGDRRVLPVTMCETPIEETDNPNESPYLRAIINQYIQFMDDNLLLVVDDLNHLVVHNLDENDNRVLAELEGKPSVFKVSLSSELIVVAVSNRVYVYSFSGQLLHTLKGCRSIVNDVGIFNRSKKVVAVGDKNLHCWDLDDAKPKDMPLFTFPDKGTQLSISESDEYISCAVKAPWYFRQLFVIDVKAKEDLLKDDRNRPKYRLCGGALFSRNTLYVIDFTSVECLSIPEWKELSSIEELGFLRTADCINEILAVSNGESIKVVAQGEHRLVDQGVENSLPIHSVSKIADTIYSISAKDCVTRDRWGVGRDRSTFDETVRHGRDTHGVEPCLFDDCVWLTCCGKAVVYDFKEQKSVSDTDWGGSHVEASLRLYSNHLLLTRADGRLSIHTDDGEKLVSSTVRDIKPLFAWQLNNEEAMLIGEEGYIRIELDRLRRLSGGQCLGRVENICHDSESPDLVYMDVSYPDNRKLISTASHLETMDEPFWSIDLEENSYLIGWLNKGESLLLVVNGEVSCVDVISGELTGVMGMSIPEHAKATCAWSDEKTLMIGLSDGTVLTSDLTDGAK